MRVAAISGTVLGTRVFRAFAPLAQLADISHPDTYNQDTNPLGTQRAIKISHARGAYQYTSGPSQSAFFPEIVLNARDPGVVQFRPSEANPNLGVLEIDESRLSGTKDKMISRVDGNHRLHFAKGDKGRKLPPVAKEVGFCLVLGLTQEQEAQLFLDINGNQKGMSTSHLDNLQYRLSPERAVIEKHFDLYVAERLCDDSRSPFFGLIHKGGERKGAGETNRSQGLKRHVNLRSLKAGIGRLLKRSGYLQYLPKGDSQYAVIRCYWTAVREVFHQDWRNPKDSLLLKGIGITVMALLGADVIDRCLLAKDPSQERMAEYLKTVARIADWSSQGEFGAYSGQKGAEKAAKQLREALAKSEDFQDLVASLEKQA
jgi:DGQHR domain-containing protein